VVIATALVHIDTAPLGSSLAIALLCLGM